MLRGMAGALGIFGIAARGVAGLGSFPFAITSCCLSLIHRSR
jgi:hypothetical protein